VERKCYLRFRVALLVPLGFSWFGEHQESLLEGVFESFPTFMKGKGMRFRKYVG
jgi:hypothetical protein